MKRLLLLSIIVVMLPLSSCDEASVNVAIPHDITHAITYFRNVPWQLVSMERDTGVVDLAKWGRFEMLFEDDQFVGKAACNTWYGYYRISHDSLIIVGAGSTLAGCRPETPIDPCDLIGSWGVTIRMNTVILAGDKGTLEFHSEYGAPVDNLSIVERQWTLISSDDTLFKPFLYFGALPRLELNADRSYNLWWDPVCDFSDAEKKGFSGFFGVKRDSGIVFRNYWSGSCGGSNTPVDRKIWGFQSVLMQASRFAATDSSLVLINPERRTYYRFTLDP